MKELPEGMIPVEEFAKQKGIKLTKAINMIRDGFHVGRKIGDDWYVDTSEPTNLLSNPSKVKSSVVAPGNGALNEVIVTDIQMSFVSMVAFMIKWVIASIPALIILFIIFSVAAIYGGALLGLGGSRY